MREIRTSGSMRGGRKRAFARRACLLLYRVPRQTLLLLLFQLTSSFRSRTDSVLSSDTCLRPRLLHEPIPLAGCRNHYSASWASDTNALTRASTKEPAAAGRGARDKPPA